MIRDKNSRLDKEKKVKKQMLAVSIKRAEIEKGRMQQFKNWNQPNARVDSKRMSRSSNCYFPPRGK